MRNMLFALLILLAGCSTMHIKEQTLDAFMMDANIEQVEEIVIVNGETGANKVITDPLQVEAFVNDTKDMMFTADDNQGQRDGFRYSVELRDGEHSLSFTPNYMNDHYYITDEALTRTIDDYFKAN